MYDAIKSRYGAFFIQKTPFARGRGITTVNVRLISAFLRSRGVYGIHISTDLFPGFFVFNLPFIAQHALLPDINIPIPPLQTTTKSPVSPTPHPSSLPEELPINNPSPLRRPPLLGYSSSHDIQSKASYFSNPAKKKSDWNAAGLGNKELKTKRRGGK